MKGRRFEYKVKKLFEAEGWVVLRCAGSKPFDLVAFKRGKVPVFVECKTTRYLPKMRETFLKEMAEKAGAEAMFVGKYEWEIIKEKLKSTGKV